MSRRFVVSKFKNTQLLEGKKEVQYNAVPPVSCDAVPIKSSISNVALRKGNQPSSAIIVPLDLPAPRQFNVEACFTVQNAAPISDIDWGFKTEAGRLLATSSSTNGILQLFDIPDKITAEVHPSAAVHSMNASEDGVDNILFHPTASSLIALSSKEQLLLTEYEKGDNVVSITLSGHIDAFDLKGDGSLATAISRNNVIGIFDFRAPAQQTATSAHAGSKQSRVIWLGNSHLICSTGFSRSREREYAIWDSRKFTQPLHSDKFDTSSSVLSPLFDTDTSLLFFYGKSDRSFRWLDASTFFSDARAYQAPATLSLTSSSICSATLVPKLSLDVLSCEVVRLLALTSDGSIIPYSGTVPRKGSSYHAGNRLLGLHN
ncbi:Coronin-7 [Phlyctochytrium planicorne]|nr:Coronin-7 [Phlyctochytrium planicorne]